MKMLRTFNALLFVFLFTFNAFALQPLKTVDVFPGTPMLTKYVGETVPGHEVPVSKGVEKIIYLNEAQREQFRVTIEDGVVYKNDGSIYRMNESMVNYVLDPKGNLYFFENEVRKELRHSSILAGQPVAAAGEAIIDPSGRIISINRASGHYKPTSEYFNAVIELLSKSGVDMNHLEITGLKK